MQLFRMKQFLNFLSSGAKVWFWWKWCTPSFKKWRKWYIETISPLNERYFLYFHDLWPNFTLGVPCASLKPLGKIKRSRETYARPHSNLHAGFQAIALPPANSLQTNLPKIRHRLHRTIKAERAQALSAYQYPLHQTRCRRDSSGWWNAAAWGTACHDLPMRLCYFLLSLANLEKALQKLAVQEILDYDPGAPCIGMAW